ncbi:pantetheine-phosphate adenylyltransferase [Allofustis seminis]|uniref:pantetheine-phosphate adenylyltransferase n=1 Tax=Allofustis seminis TaxID=166939 RepID=UPI000382A943|nr:pantetheine-phosphate adenylyltransferase [Allofustis seminis]
MKKAIYVGSFDPFTYGHLNILKRAVSLFDEIIIAIGTNPSKQSLFRADEKYDIILKIIQQEDLNNVKVIQYEDELTAHLVERLGVQYLIRGLRSTKDFEYEMDMAAVNRALNSSLESIFLMSDSRYRSLSSSVVKEIAKFNGDISSFVPEIVAQAMKKKYS